MTMHTSPDGLHYVAAGDQISASQWNRLISRLKGQAAAQPGMYSDGTGVYVRRLPRPPGATDFVPYFYNDSGETIPPFSVMGVSGTISGDGMTVIKVVKPSSTYRMDYLVNGDVSVKYQNLGYYQNYPVVMVAYDTGSPSVQLFGPKADQWTASAGATGTGGTGTTLRSDWGLVIHGIYDSTNKLAFAKQVCYGRAKMCWAQAKISSGHDLSIVDNVVPMHTGWSPTANASDEITLGTDDGTTWKTNDNAWGKIVYDDYEDKWYAIDFPGPPCC